MVGGERWGVKEADRSGILSIRPEKRVAGSRINFVKVWTVTLLVSNVTHFAFPFESILLSSKNRCVFI